MPNQLWIYVQKNFQGPINVQRDTKESPWKWGGLPEAGIDDLHWSSDEAGNPWRRAIDQQTGRKNPSASGDRPSLRTHTFQANRTNCSKRSRSRSSAAPPPELWTRTTRRAAETERRRLPPPGHGGGDDRRNCRPPKPTAPAGVTPSLPGECWVLRCLMKGRRSRPCSSSRCWSCRRRRRGGRRPAASLSWARLPPASDAAASFPSLIAARL